MSKQSIINRLEAMNLWADKNPQYQHIAELHKGILRIILEIEERPNKGAVRNLQEKEIDSLIDIALSTKTPIIRSLEPSIFKAKIIKDSVIKATEHLTKSGTDEWKLSHLSEALRSNKIDINKAILAVINEDTDWFKETGEKYGAEPPILIYIFSLPLQPFFEDLSTKVQSRLRERWFESYCPVCGRQSSIARMLDRKRYMVCMYCSTEYLIDQFTCVNCGNNDPNTLGFISLEEYPGYEIDYCEKCSKYIKVIYPDRVINKIPQGFEDLFTWELDDFAENSGLGLKRN